MYIIEAIEGTDKAINQIARDQSLILQDMAVIKNSLERHTRSTKPLRKAEIQQMIQIAQQKKNGNGGKELSEAEMEAIVKKVMKARLVAVADLRHWKFIFLVVMIAASYFVPELDLTRFVEFLK